MLLVIWNKTKSQFYAVWLSTTWHCRRRHRRPGWSHAVNEVGLSNVFQRTVASGRQHSDENVVKGQHLESLDKKITWKTPLFRGHPILLIAKFHYTGPTGPDRTRADPNGPARTLSETGTDPTEFRRKKVRAGPCGSGRARVVEFSSYPTTCADFVWSGRVRSGPCSGI